MLQDWKHRPTHYRVWALAAPMILSNITVPLVTLVDNAVIGHLPYAHQLGAVAVGGSLFSLLAWMMGFLRMGTTGFAAQAAGRGDGAALRQVLVQGLALAMVFASVLGVLAIPLGNALLAWMNPSAALTADTLAFFHTRLWALPATLADYALVGWFLGNQNARAPLAVMLATNSLNIALNLWFVLGLDWGVVGSARASVLAEWAACLLGLALTRPALRRHPGKVNWQALRQGANWWPMLAVNRDIFLRTLVLQGVMFMLTAQGARLGDATVAANALLLAGLTLISQALDGLAHAVEALCGHAIGAGNRLELRRALVVSLGWALLASLGFAMGFALFGEQFISLQTNIATVRATAQEYLPYLALLPLVAVWSYLLDGLFIGATRAREMRNAMLATAALCAPLAWAIQGLGNHGLWMSFLAFMLLRAATLGWLGWRLQQRGQWA